MAKLPTSIPDLVRRHGPTLHSIPSGGWTRNAQEDAGQGPLLLLWPAMRHSTPRDKKKVVGFEPWEEFPSTSGSSVPRA